MAAQETGEPVHVLVGTLAAGCLPLHRVVADVDPISAIIIALAGSPRVEKVRPDVQYEVGVLRVQVENERVRQGGVNLSR